MTAAPALAQTNQDLLKERRDKEKREWEDAKKRNSQPAPPLLPTVPLPAGDNPVWKRLEYLEEAHKKGEKTFFIHAYPGFWDVASRDPYRNYIATLETVILEYEFDVINLLALPTPALRRLELRSTPGRWEAFEEWLDQLVKSDPAGAGRLTDRLAQLPEVVLDLEAAFGLTQAEFDKTLQTLSRSKRINGLKLTLGRPMERWEVNGLVWPPPANDIRGLARLPYLREIRLCVGSLDTVSLGFPRGLQTLAVRELGNSSDGLSHVLIPPRLRTLLVESHSSATRDRFAALASDARVADCRITHLPVDFLLRPQRERELEYGTWRKQSAEPGSVAAIDITKMPLSLQSQIVPHGGSDTSLVPGYKISFAEVRNSIGPDADEAHGFSVVLQDREFVQRDRGFDTIIKGRAELTVQVKGGRMIFTPYPTKDVFYGGLIKPNDKVFERAAFQALQGEWQRPELAIPQMTELGPEDEPAAPGEPSSSVSTQQAQKFLPAGVAGVLIAATGMGLFAWWRLRKGRRDRFSPT